MGKSMFARIGYKAVELTTKALDTAVKRTVGRISGDSDVVAFTSQRIKNLELYRYKSDGIRKHLFNFTKYGNINIIQRMYGSEDLKFLAHIRSGKYVQPKMYPVGTFSCSKSGIEQSNKLAKEFIGEYENLIDGYRYCGPNAIFNDSGKNISRIINGYQEIVVLDRTIDSTLVKTINAFKNRINGKNFTDEQKIDELMKFVDEVFSVSKIGEETGKYVSNMMKERQVEVLLGDIINSGAGVCRHRALLTKVLADELNIKCRIVHGYYNGGGHAWNELITNRDTYLFDAMQGRICSVGNASRNLDPESFSYRITNPKYSGRLISRYLDKDSPVGIIYSCLKYKVPVNTKYAHLIPTTEGYSIEPLTNNVFVNGVRITGAKKLSVGDFVNLKDIGFQII